MKPARTAVSLSTRLRETHLSWRRKELSYYHSLVTRQSPSSTTQKHLIRGGIALTYAHWEGFVKIAAEEYVNFVEIQSLPCNKLSNAMLALAMKRVSIEAQEDTDSHQQVVLFFRNSMMSPARLRFRRMINTKANLKPSVFRSIVRGVGLPYLDEYQIAEKPIIDRLLELRNNIAHGDPEDIGPEEYGTLESEILQLIELFCTQIENAACQKLYMLPTVEHTENN